MYTVLSIAGSDSGGGAGIQADLKTMLANNVYGMAAITAITAQNTTGILGIRRTDDEMLQLQLEAVFSDFPVDAVKIGMVCDAIQGQIIGETLEKYKAKNVVIDPVMASTSGISFTYAKDLAKLKKYLFSRAFLLTPNLSEAKILAGLEKETLLERTDRLLAAKLIAEELGCNVLIKGGHLSNEPEDLLWIHDLKQEVIFTGKRIQNPNNHGTGCTLSSAIAANLAKGYTLPEAIRKAKSYLETILASGLDLGKGNGPMNHGTGLSGKYFK